MSVFAAARKRLEPTWTAWNGVPPTAAELGAVVGQERIRMCAKRKNQFFGTWLWDVDSVANLNEDGWDVYYIINPTRDDFVGIKPSDKDIKVCKALLLDLDPKDGITEADFKKSFFVSVVYYITFTGRGIQLVLNIPPTSVKTFVPHARGALRACATFVDSYPEYAFNVDTCTSDASRLARWPNTINWKTGVRGCSLLGTAKDVWSFYANAAPIYDAPAQDINTTLTKLSEIAPRLNTTASTFLLDGTDSLKRSRHTAAYATARNLREIGLSYDAARELILQGAAICTRGGHPFPLNAEDAEHAVRTAYK